MVIRSVSPLPYNLHSPYLVHTLIMVGTCQPGMCHLTWTTCIHSHNPVIFSSFMTYHRIVNKSEIMGPTCGAGTAYPSRPLFVFLSFFFWSLYCLSLFSLWLLITHLVFSTFLIYLVYKYLLIQLHLLSVFKFVNLSEKFNVY